MAVESLSSNEVLPGRKEKVTYERPFLEKMIGMDFPLQILSKATGQVVCKQCSSCHGCR